MTMRLALPPVETISRKADDINPAKVLLGLFLGIFLALGWLAAKFWRCLQLIIASIEVGWKEGLAKSSDSG